MKKAIFQLAMRCEVGVEKLTQREIDQYTKRSVNKNEEKVEPELNTIKRKVSSVCDFPNKKQKIHVEDLVQSTCGSELQTGNNFIADQGYKDLSAVNGSSVFLQDNQNMTNGVLPSSRLNAAQSVPESISRLQKIGITVSSVKVGIKKKKVGKDTCTRPSAAQNPVQELVQHLSAVQSAESCDLTHLNKNTHEPVIKKRGRPKQKMSNLNSLSSGLQNNPVKGKSSKSQEVLRTLRQNVSLDNKPSNNVVPQQIPIKEAKNNKLSGKPKKSYTVMRTGKLQAHNENSSLYSAMSNNYAESMKPTEGNNVVNIPSGVTLIQYGTQSSTGSKKAVPNRSNYPMFDRESILCKSSFDRPSSEGYFNGRPIGNFFNNNPTHITVSYNGPAVHHDTFITENCLANQALQPFDTNAGMTNPVIKTETGVNNASFIHSVQENVIIQRSAFDIPLPDFLRTSLDMPDISDAVSNCTSRQCGQVWKRSSSETHTVNNFGPLPRRHSVDQFRVGFNQSLEHPLQQQNERANFRGSGPTHSHQRLEPNVLTKNLSHVQNENCATLKNYNFIHSSEKLSTDASNYLVAPQAHAIYQEAIESELNSLQNFTIGIANQTPNDSTHVQSIEGEFVDKCNSRETEKIADGNVPASKYVSIQHSVSSLSSNSLRKERIIQLFGESDEDIAIDHSCPSPENFFRRISNKNLSLEDRTEADFKNSLSSPTDKVEGSETCVRNKLLTPGNATLESGNLEQLELDTSDIDKLFPSAADNEGDNSNKIQILPHKDDAISCRPVVDSPSGDHQLATSTQSSETRIDSVVHSVAQPSVSKTVSILTENFESSASEKSRLQLQPAEYTGHVSLEQVEHASKNLDVVSSVIAEKTAETTDLTQQLSNKPTQNGPNMSSGQSGQVTDSSEPEITKVQLSSGDVALSSKYFVPTSECVSSNTEAQIHQMSESSGSANCGSDTVQYEFKPSECEVPNKACDVTGNNDNSPDVSEASKHNESKAYTVLDSNIPSEVSCGNILHGSNVGADSDVQVQQLVNTVGTKMTLEDNSSRTQLHQGSENSRSENATETSDPAPSCPVTDTSNVAPTQNQNNAGMTSPVCENPVAILQSGENNGTSTTEQSASTKDITSGNKYMGFSSIPLKKEVDCDRNVNGVTDGSECLHSHASDFLSSNNSIAVAEEAQPTRTSADLSMTMDDLIGVNPSIRNGSSNTCTRTQRVGAESNKMAENGLNKINSSITASAQSWPDQNVLCESSKNNIPLNNSNNETALAKCIINAAPMYMNLESGLKSSAQNTSAQNTSAQNTSSQIGTIRVRDVNSLVEPARVSKAILSSPDFEEFTFLIYNILSNRSRLRGRLKAAQSLRSNYSKIECELAVRDFMATLHGQEIMFTDFLLKKSKTFGSFPPNLRMATLSRIESEYGQKYTMKELEICLQQIEQQRRKCETKVQESAQEDKPMGNITPEKDGSRQQGTDTASITPSLYQPDVRQDPVKVVKNIHPNYGNYQRSDIGPASQLQPQNMHASTVDNSNAEGVSRNVSQNSVLGSLLVHEKPCRKSQDTQMQHSVSNCNQGIQQHRINVPPSVHTTNEVSETQGIAYTIQNQTVKGHVQQNLQNDSSIGYRRQQEMHQGTYYRPAVDRTSVIRQANEPSNGNPVYGNNQLAVSTTGIRKEAKSALVHNPSAYAQPQTHGSVAANNQNIQNVTNVPNPVYINSAMTVPGANTQNVGQVISSNANLSQSVFIDQLHYTVNRYTTYTGAPRAQQSHNTTIPSPQVYQSTVVHQVPGALPTYSEATQMRQAAPTNHASYTKQYERHVSQQLQNNTAAQPVDQSLQQVNNNRRLMSNDFYMSGIAGNSPNLASNPYQTQDSSSNLQHTNPANISQVQSSTFQQYLGTPSQQYNGVSNQQVHNFRQNVVHNSFHQGQIPNQQYSHISSPFSQQAIASAYQLYSRKGQAAPNVTIVPNSNNHTHQGNVQNVANMKQVDYDQSSGAAIQRTVRTDQHQPFTSELQRVAHMNNASKSVERVAKSVQRASVEQNSVCRTTNSNHAVNDNQSIQFSDSFAGLQQHQQPTLMRSPTSVQARSNCATISSQGFVHPPEVTPPAEQIAAATGNNLETVIMVYDRSNEPRTVSRDSGYTTPSPTVSTNVNINPSDLPECHEGPEIIKTEKELKCVRCGKTARELCSACRNASYCSKDCQVKDWDDSHYAVCKPSTKSGTTNVA